MTQTPGETPLLPSRHNILGPVHRSDGWFIVNPLSRQADLLTAEEARQISRGTVTEPAEWVAKGYLVDPDEEERRFRQAYLEFAAGRAADEVQIFFVPWYACNFACHYCYQAPYENPQSPLDPEVIDAFFDHVQKAFAGRPKYLTLFGGEPLLPGKNAELSIAYFLEKATALGLDVAVVTNGYTLESYMPLLERAHIRELQITLDGPPEVHDRRRVLRSGRGTFEQIARGVDLALERGLPVNLRINLDRDNLPSLPALAEIAIARGWTRHAGFKTQLGRNYELHHCHSGTTLYDRLELYQDLWDLIREHPQVMQYHRPSYSIARFLFDHGEVPEPLFDSCPACKTEWAFDYTGTIYSCTATVGKPGEALGTFHPRVSLDEEAVARWEERDVLAIDACRSCSQQLACGGGCGSVSKNRTGDVATPDCRPIKELLVLGTALYFSEGPTHEPQDSIPGR